LQKAVQHNPLIRIERIDVDIAQRSFKESYYRFEPSLSASLEQNRVIDNGYSTAPQYEGAVQLNGVLPSGTAMSVKSSVSPNSRITNPGNSFQRGLELTVTQSLLANGGFSSNLSTVRKASIDLDMRHEELAAYAQRLLADVERAYWELYLADKEAVIHRQSLDLANRLLYESEEKLNAGKIAPLDLVTVKAEVATRQKNLINAQAGYIQRKLRLSYLLNDSIPLWDIPLVVTDKPVQPGSPDSLQYHLEAARKFRSDLRLARHQLDKGDLDVAQTRNGLLPRLDAFITLAGTAYAASFSETVHDAEYNSTGMSAGLSLSLPLTNGAARQRYQKALLSRKQQDMSIENLQKLMELDVRSAWTEVNRSISQITAAENARKLQEQKLAAEQARLAAGKSTEYLILQAQRDLVTSQLDEARAEVGYVNAVTDLYLKDGTLLERRGVTSQ
jgi:outer membrane protein TolC